jgi:hypothetical protein
MSAISFSQSCRTHVKFSSCLDVDIHACPIRKNLIFRFFSHTRHQLLPSRVRTTLCTLAAAVAGTPQGQRCAVLPLVAPLTTACLVDSAARPSRCPKGRRSKWGVLSTRCLLLCCQNKGKAYCLHCRALTRRCNNAPAGSAFGWLRHLPRPSQPAAHTPSSINLREYLSLSTQAAE